MFSLGANTPVVTTVLRWLVKRTHRRQTGMRGLRRQPKGLPLHSLWPRERPGASKARRALPPQRYDLTALLAREGGDISPIVRPLFDALTSQTLARSATKWLTVNPVAKQHLRDLATGAAPRTHDTFTTHPSPESAGV